MRLLDLPHSRVQSLLAAGAPVYLPVNPVEYHGPHLSLHNDALVSQGLAREIHAELLKRGEDWPLLLASDLEVGVDPVGGPGSRATPYREVCSLVVAACRALAEMGAKRVVLITFHGAALHSLALDAGVRWLTRHGVRAMAPLNLLLRQMLTLKGEEYAAGYTGIHDDAIRAEMIEHAPHDFHAGYFETSMALHYAPESVDPIFKLLPPCPKFAPDAKLLAASRAAERFGRATLARELSFAATGLGWFGVRPFPGYTSRPSFASPEAGAFFAKQMVPGFALSAARVFSGEEEAPKPIMAWMSPMTLGGTLPGASVPVDAINRFESIRSLA